MSSYDRHRNKSVRLRNYQFIFKLFLIVIEICAPTVSYKKRQIELNKVTAFGNTKNYIRIVHTTFHHLLLRFFSELDGKFLFTREVVSNAMVEKNRDVEITKV